VWRVLLVDDNPINQRVAKAMLVKLGCLVEVAANGREGLDKTLAAQPPYDIIFMDCQMPVMDGYEASQEIRRGERGEAHIPIIALTASALPEDRVHCLAAGMDGYLSKPASLAELQAALVQWAGPAHRHK
jgi:CheY-like chemotaxis protein